MTRKDYEKFAKMFYVERPQADDTEEIKDMWSNLVYTSAAIFQADNARFDVERFFTACGMPD